MAGRRERQRSDAVEPRSRTTVDDGGDALVSLGDVRDMPIVCGELQRAARDAVVTLVRVTVDDDVPAVGAFRDEGNATRRAKNDLADAIPAITDVTIDDDGPLRPDLGGKCDV